jgi:cytoskeletal protein CcmA (bactofilin family)
VSCFSELTYAIYADRELPPEEARPVEAHLVQCRPCRERVMELRAEASLLTDLLQERVRAPMRSAARSEAARGVALGLGPTLLAAAGAALALGWILETLGPMARQWIGPFTLRGVYGMAFDLFFLLRDEVPALLEVGLAIAAMASASALLTFALSAMLRRWSGPGLLTLAALLALGLPAGPSHAHFGWHEHEDYRLPAGETHDGTLVVSAQNADVDGIVAGDLITLSHHVTIRGEVRGNVIAVARSFELVGVVTGSVHVGAGRTHVSGEVRGNLYAFTEAFTLGSTGRVLRDAAILGDSAVLEGRVERDLYLGGERAELRGRIGRNVEAWAHRVALLDGARVGGDVRALLPRGEEVAVASGAQIDGQVETRERQPIHGRGLDRFLQPSLYLWLILHIGAGFLVGMVLHALLPGVYDGRLATAGEFFRTLGLGFLVFVAAPVTLALTALTLVGVPLAVMGLCLYLSSLYAGLIVVAALLGTAVVHADSEGWRGFGLALLAGLAILAVATHVPFLGPLVQIVAVLVGLGLLAQRAHLAFRALHGAPA